MEKIILERGLGKTKSLIVKSARFGHYIVCANFDEAHRIKSFAEEMGLKIPLPITYREFVNKEYHSKGISGFLIDNLERLFEYMSDVPVHAVTMIPFVSEQPEESRNAELSNDNYQKIKINMKF